MLGSPKKQGGWAEWLVGDKKLSRGRSLEGPVVESQLRGRGDPRPLGEGGGNDGAAAGPGSWAVPPSRRP